MKAKSILLCALLCALPAVVHAQFVFGNTGLMHMPSADMQRDKTFMAGWNWLDMAALPQSGAGWSKEPTMNYYINMTLFPWMEVSYTCTLFRGKYLAEGIGVDPKYFKKWANQDRHFDFRFRLWKEGWWKSWTPQIVLGMNDALHTFEGGGSGQIGTTDSGNGFWGRQYIVATKHIDLKRVGTVGAHVAYLHNNRKDFHFQGIAAGANLKLDNLDTGSPVVNKIVNGFNVMAEYDTRTFNAGAKWDIGFGKGKRDGQSLFDLFLVCEMNKLKHFSGGGGFKVHLK